MRLGKLLRFLKPYRTQVWLIIALVLFQTLTELYLPALMASIVDQGVVTGDIGHIWRVGGMMMSVAAVGVAAAIWTTRISARTASAFGRDLRSSMFRRVTEFSMREFDELGTATLITRTTNDVTQVQQVLFMTLRMMVSAPLMAVGGVMMALATEWSVVGHRGGGACAGRHHRRHRGPGHATFPLASGKSRHAQSGGAGAAHRRAGGAGVQPGGNMSGAASARPTAI